MTDLTAARKQLINIRNKHGAKSPIGSRCSQAIEIMQNLEKFEFMDRILVLRGSLATTLMEIQALQSGCRGPVQVRREVAFHLHVAA